MNTQRAEFDPDKYLDNFRGDISKSADLRDALREVYALGRHTDIQFLTALRAANLSRVPRFGHGELTGPKSWGPMQWGCALAGEVGELCNMLKKLERQMPTDPAPDDLDGEIAREIADVLIYLDLLAATFEFDLARIVRLKFNSTSKKFGFPERL